MSLEGTVASTISYTAASRDRCLHAPILVLQRRYGLSDPEPERQAMDRISFRQIPIYPGAIPDRSTIRPFRERLAQIGKDAVIREEFQQHLELRALTIK